MDHPLPSADHPLPSANHPLPSASHPPPSASHPLPSAKTPLPSASRPLPSVSRSLPFFGYPHCSTAQTTTYDLDNLGRVTTITYPDSKTIQYQYYPQGTVKKRTDQRNIETNYQYDHVGNLVEKTVTFDGADYEETFAYDGLGRMLEADKYRGATHIATSEFEYNAFSKVTEATETILGADAVEIGYDYDQLGNLTGITYPDANDVTISREALGRIDTIKLDSDTIASYQYVGPRVKRRTYNNPSVTYDITYNGLGQATRHYSYTSGTDIADFEYEYDDNGNITKQEFNHRDSTPYNDYDYDDLDRLTDADYLVGVLTEDEQFTYDDLGNRTNVNLRSGSDESYSVDNLTNRYNSVGGNSLDYDDAGNLTQDPNGYEYEYDYENRLIEITKGETTIAQYEYDALGRRIQKTDSIASETTRYYYDNQWRVLAEFDDNDTQLRDFIYGNYIDEVLVMTDSSENAYYYAHNHIYSPVALIDEDGNVVEQYEYNAYGSPTIYNNDFSQTYDSSQYDNPYMFTGRHMDSLDNDAKKLGFNRNRYVDYYTGRWIATDPIGYEDGLNLYEYALANPVIYNDIYGLKSQCKIYLTFDDGPLWGTDDVLDVLKEVNLKATFFVVGVHIERNFKLKNSTWRGMKQWTGSDMIKIMVRDGHLVANHSYSHKHLPSDWYDEKDAPTRFLKDFNKNASLLMGILNEILKDLGDNANEEIVEKYKKSIRPDIARLPGRNIWRHDGFSFGESNVADKLVKSGYSVFGWDIEYKQGKHSEVDRNKLIESIEKRCCGKPVTHKPGKVVILFHDLYHRASKGGRKPLKYFLEKLKKGSETMSYKFEKMDKY